MLTLKLQIGKTQKKLPEGEIIFNDQSIHRGSFDKDVFKLNPVVGKNTLQISLSNKKDTDTIIKGNQITEDVYVKVVDISCDTTKDSVGHLDTIGNYKTQKGEDLKTYGFLSYNGTYSFVFDYPFFVFQRNKIFYQ